MFQIEAGKAVIVNVGSGGVIIYERKGKRHTFSGEEPSPEP